MNKIVSKTQFSENVFELVVQADLIATSRKPGNFVIVRVDAQSERIPLTIAASDEKQGTITLIVQQNGVSMWWDRWGVRPTLRSSEQLFVRAVEWGQHRCCRLPQP